MSPSNRSAEAGVSQRTFSNYFPTKESAVAPTPLEIPDDLAADSFRSNS
jgi:AcrR family transcriptional regulator